MECVLYIRATDSPFQRRQCLEEEGKPSWREKLFQWISVPCQLHVPWWASDNCPADVTVPRGAGAQTMQVFPACPLLSGQMGSAESADRRAWLGFSPSKHPHLPDPLPSPECPHLPDPSTPYSASGPNLITMSSVNPAIAAGSIWALLSAAQQTLFVHWFNTTWGSCLVVGTTPELCTGVTFRCHQHVVQIEQRFTGKNWGAEK